MSDENSTNLFDTNDDNDDGYEIDATYAKSRIKPITNNNVNINNSVSSNNSNDGSPIRRKHYEKLGLDSRLFQKQMKFQRYFLCYSKSLFTAIKKCVLVQYARISTVLVT